MHSTCIIEVASFACLALLHATSTLIVSISPVNKSSSTPSFLDDSFSAGQRVMISNLRMGIMLISMQKSWDQLKAVAGLHQPIKGAVDDIKKHNCWHLDPSSLELGCIVFHFEPCMRLWFKDDTLTITKGSSRRMQLGGANFIN